MKFIQRYKKCCETQRVAGFQIFGTMFNVKIRRIITSTTHGNVET